MLKSDLVQQIHKDLEGALTENQILSVLHLAETLGMRPPFDSEYFRSLDSLNTLDGCVWEEFQK